MLGPPASGAAPEEFSQFLDSFAESSEEAAAMGVHAALRVSTLRVYKSGSCIRFVFKGPARLEGRVSVGWIPHRSALFPAMTIIQKHGC